MTFAKCAAALVAAAFVAGASVPAQAQYLFSGDNSGWQASSVDSPNRDFPSTGAQLGGSYAYTFGFAPSATGFDANASCYPAHVRHRLANGHVVSRAETVCP